MVIGHVQGHFRDGAGTGRESLLSCAGDTAPLVSSLASSVGRLSDGEWASGGSTQLQ